jgi:apolipoprotein N-acyltransferase
MAGADTPMRTSGPPASEVNRLRCPSTGRKPFEKPDGAPPGLWRPPAWFWAAVASGGLLVFAFPPFDHGWLAWVAPAPLLACWMQPCPRPALAGFVAGLVFFLAFFSWVRFFAVEAWIGTAVASAAFWALCGAGAGLGARRAPAAAAPLIVAAAWTATEWLRAQGRFCFPWGTLAATQHRALPVLQMLDTTGPYGLTFLMTLTSAAAAAVALRRPRGWVVLASALALVVAASGRGAWLLAAAPRVAPAQEVRSQGTVASLAPPTADGAGAPTWRTAVIQASTAVASQTAAVDTRDSLDEYERWTLAAKPLAPRLVVWPETTLPRRTSQAAGIRAELAQTLPPGGWLLGGESDQDAETGGETNSAMALNSTGGLGGRYDKVVLVPFGEYVPARALFPWVVQYGVPAADLAAGHGWEPVSLGERRVGALICFESSFPQAARALAQNGADLLAFITSDGWAGRSGAALQHAAMAPLRAVETRRSVARAAATGVSALIDPYGRVLAEVPLFERGYAAADLPLRSDLSWYTRFGDWPVWLCLGLLLVASVRITRRGGGSRGPGVGRNEREITIGEMEPLPRSEEGASPPGGEEPVPPPPPL